MKKKTSVGAKGERRRGGWRMVGAGEEATETIKQLLRVCTHGPPDPLSAVLPEPASQLCSHSLHVHLSAWPLRAKRLDRGSVWAGSVPVFFNSNTSIYVC